MGRDCATVGRSDGRTVSNTTITRLRFLNLRSNELLVAVWTISVTELGLGSRFDIALDRFPLFRRIADPFAVRANRQQSLELLHMLAQAEDPLRVFEPRAHLVLIARLGTEIFASCFHSLANALLYTSARIPQEISEPGR